MFNALTAIVKIIWMNYQLVVFFSLQLCLLTKNFKYNTIELKIYRKKPIVSKFICNTCILQLIFRTFYLHFLYFKTYDY